MEWAYNTSNRANQPREHEIATATNIKRGAVVTKTDSLVVLCDYTDMDDPQLGVTAEAHNGSSAGRQSGTKVKVYDHPDDVFKVKPRKVVTATGGSTTTFVNSNLRFATDDHLNGGVLQIVNCQADSSLNGKKVLISDYTASGGTVTLSETLPVALQSGDTAYICPGKKAIGTFNWNLSDDGTDMDWEDASAGEAVQIHDVDPSTFTVFVKLRLHLNGNHPIAV